jgi:hypothetical protein
MNNEMKQMLMRALYTAIGNKLYMADIERLLDRIELTPNELQAIRYLASDIGRMGDKPKQWRY